MQQQQYATEYVQVPVGEPVWVQDAVTSTIQSSPSMLAYPAPTPSTAPKPATTPSAAPKPATKAKAKKAKSSKKKAKKGCC